MARHAARWLLVVIAAGCAKSEGTLPDPYEFELRHQAIGDALDNPDDDDRARPRGVPSECGEPSTIGIGRWREGDERIRGLSEWLAQTNGAGRVVAVRDTLPGVGVPGWAHLKLRIDGGMRQTMGCWVVEGSTAEELVHDGCRSAGAVLPRLSQWSPPDDRAEARAWVDLLGSFDDAAAVFDDRTTLERCEPALPSERIANLPHLGVDSAYPEIDITFVERLEPAPGTTMFVLVEADAALARVRRTELWTPPRAHTPEAAPRTPTPAADACVSLIPATISPPLHAGPLYDLTRAQLALRERVDFIPVAVALLDDPFGLPGLSVVASAGLIDGLHRHSESVCLLDELRSYCSREDLADLGPFVRDRGLAPRDLDEAQWLALVTTMADARLIVRDPARVDECSEAARGHAIAPSVEIHDDRVELRFAAVRVYSGLRYDVSIRKRGGVKVRVRDLWRG